MTDAAGGRRHRRRLAALVASVLLVALAARTLLLFWSPLPTTLDGLLYTARAEATLADGAFPLARFRADSFVFTGVLAMAGAAVGERPLTLAQPVVAVVGAASCLVAIALVRRLGRRLRWDRGSILLGAGIAGYGLAVEGLYLRRSGVTDEEALAFLLVPLFALALHRALTGERRRRWWGLTLAFAALFPLLHTFSSLVAGMTLTGVAAIAAVDRLSARRTVVAAAAIAGFWAYVGGYYAVARSFLTVPYVDRVTAYPGLFVAWLVVIAVGGVWLRRTSGRAARTVVVGPLLLWFGLLLANGGRSVFPGTQTTPPALLALVAALLVPVVLFGVGLPAVAREGEVGPVTLALLLGPIAVVSFSLTAALTPEYFATALRGQTFLHLALFVCVAAGVVGLARRRDPAGTGRPDAETAGSGGRDGTTPATDGGGSLRTSVAAGLVVVVLAAALATTPLALVHLDTMSYPATTTGSAFGAANFAAERTTGDWASDDPLSRVAGHYNPGTNVSQRPVVAWLSGDGGVPPRCPTLTRRSWATSGAHLFPAPAETVDADAFRSFHETGDVVYSVRGHDAVRLAVPGRAGRC